MVPALCPQCQGGFYRLMPQRGLRHLAEGHPRRSQGGDGHRRWGASHAEGNTAGAGRVLSGALRRAEAAEAQSVLARPGTDALMLF